MITAKILENGMLQTTSYIKPPNKLPLGEIIIEKLPDDEVSLHFIDCWTLEGSRVVVDITKAKEKRSLFIQELIEEALINIDNKTARAVRDAILTGDKRYVERLETKAQELRVVRQNTGVDQITSLEELAAYLPEILNEDDS